MCKELSTKKLLHHGNLSTRTIDVYRYKLMEKTNSRNMIGIAIFNKLNAPAQLCLQAAIRHCSGFNPKLKYT
jgi:hypothetical protein